MKNFEKVLVMLGALVFCVLGIVRDSIRSSSMTWRLCAIIVAATPVVVSSAVAAALLTHPTLLT